MGRPHGPFYDNPGENNAVLPTYYGHQPVNVTSLGDLGGSINSLTHLNNYLRNPEVASQASGYVPTTCLLCAADGDTAIAFANHAGNGEHSWNEQGHV